MKHWKRYATEAELLNIGKADTRIRQHGKLLSFWSKYRRRIVQRVKARARRAK